MKNYSLLYILLIFLVLIGLWFSVLDAISSYIMMNHSMVFTKAGIVVQSMSVPIIILALVIGKNKSVFWFAILSLIYLLASVLFNIDATILNGRLEFNYVIFTIVKFLLNCAILVLIWILVKRGELK